jgi:hypothetical protein
MYSILCQVRLVRHHQTCTPENKVSVHNVFKASFNCLLNPNCWRSVMEVDSWKTEDWTGCEEEYDPATPQWVTSPASNNHRPVVIGLHVHTGHVTDYMVSFDIDLSLKIVGSLPSFNEAMLTPYLGRDEPI